MNNCCDDGYAEGGTLNKPQIIDPSIIGGIINNASLTGGVILDAATVTSLVNQLCSELHNCVLQIVDGAELSSMKLENTILSGGITLDDDVAQQIVDRICRYLDTCVINIVQDNILTNVQLATPSITGGQFKNAQTLDSAAAQSIADAVKPLLSDYIKQVVLDGVLDGIRLSNAAIDGLALRGTVTLDAAARTSVVNELCESLTECIINAVQANRLTGVQLESPGFSGSPTLTLDAVEAIGNALNDKIQASVHSALTDGTLCCLHIVGATIDQSKGTGNTWTNTTLDGNTNINGPLTLGADAIANMCLQMQPCIDERFNTLWDQRGKVVADQVTIIGTGASDNPLKLNTVTDIDARLLPAVTTQTELPTTIIGDRSQLMGKPDAFVKIGAFIIPAFRGQ